MAEQKLTGNLGGLGGSLGGATSPGPSSSHLTVVTPKYKSGDPMGALKLYEAAVKKLDPTYDLSQGVWSPLTHQKSAGQIDTLLREFSKTKMGEGAYHEAEASYKKQHPTDPTQYAGMGGEKRMQAAGKYGELSKLNSYVQQLEKRGVSEDEARRALYYQLGFGEKPDKKGKTPKVVPNAYNTFTSEGQNAAYLKSPQGKTDLFYNYQILPQVQATAQKLVNAASALQTYQGLSSKGRTAFLAHMGYTSGTDIYRGLTAYMPKDVSVTPETLYQAAQDLQTDKGTQEFATKFIEDQAKQAGTQTNDLNAMLGTSGMSKSQQKLLSNMNPLDQLIYLRLSGGEIGQKKSTSGSSGTFDTSLFK